jgi:hypothetical protein
MKIDREINVIDNLKKAKKKAYRLKNKERINNYISQYRLNNKNKIAKTTHAYYLKNCNTLKEYSKNYRLNNIEHYKEYHLNNKDKKKKYQKEYRLKNKEKGKEYKRLYSLNNRNLINANTAKRRASKLNATPKFANVKKIKEIYKNCPKGFHVDHIIPLNNKLVCGLHVEWNLQYLPAKENLSKSNKLI